MCYLLLQKEYYYNNNLHLLIKHIQHLQGLYALKVNFTRLSTRSTHTSIRLIY